MITTTFPESETDTMTLEIEWHGRRFSPAPDAPPRLPRRPIRRLPARRDDTELPTQLREVIWNRLPSRLLSSKGTDRQSLVQAYIASLNQLAVFRRDVENLVRSACLANIEFSSGRGETNVRARDAA